MRAEGVKNIAAALRQNALKLSHLLAKLGILKSEWPRCHPPEKMKASQHPAKMQLTISFSSKRNTCLLLVRQRGFGAVA